MSRRSYGEGSYREHPPQSGRWQGRYRGRAFMLDASCESDARKKSKAQRDAIDAEIDGPVPSRLTMNDLFDDYRANYLADRHTDIEHVDQRLKHLRPLIGHMDPHQFDQADMRRYAAKRLEQITHLGTPTSHSTINREIAVVSASMRLAAERLHRIVRFKKYSEEHAIRQGIVSETDYRRMLHELPDHVKPFWALSYYTGVRKGELLLLRWEWMDWESWLIRVPGWLNRERITKNGKPHLILLYCNEMREYIKFAWQRRDSAKPCLFQYAGECIKSFRTAFENARERLGLSGLIFHDLRRTAARNMRRNGLSEELAMKVGGWCTPSVFRRYRILDEMELQEAAQYLGGFYDGPRTGAPKIISGENLDKHLDKAVGAISGPDLTQEPKFKQ